MDLPNPEPGLVIRYAYLWRQEARRGQEEGRKSRPCVIAAVLKGKTGTLSVIVVPITHTPPPSGEEAVELPPPVKRRLGLDVWRSWIITTEANAFIWPGPDLRPIASTAIESGVAYGYLPRRLSLKVIELLRTNIQANPKTITSRTE